MAGTPMDRTAMPEFPVITHPDKRYWPEDGITKARMIDYYRRMAPLMLPWFRDRPVTLRLFPKGIHGPAFYRRERPGNAPPSVRALPYRTATDHHRIDLMLIDDLEGLLYLANLGAIEFHLWSSRAPRLDRPDWAIFDLDPGNRADFGQVLETAVLLHEHLKARGHDACAKTSGATGLHIYCLNRDRLGFEGLRNWVRDTAETLARHHPELIATAHGKTHSGKRITIDHAQNGIGKNTAAPYTLRALPGAPVSTPVSWQEIERGQIRPDDFTLDRLPDRVEAVGDLFSPLLNALN